MSTRHGSAKAARAPGLATLGPVVLLIACQQAVPNPTPTDPTGRAESNIILGRVTNEPGDPVTTARIRIQHFVDGERVGTASIDTGLDGEYRAVVPPGAYLVSGQATIDFNDNTFLFDLVPTDGQCGQQQSETGIVKDFVLKLTGPHPCPRGGEPSESNMGAWIFVGVSLTEDHRPDAVIEFTLTPDGPLANGAPGPTLTMNRTVADLDESTVLDDLPLANYLVRAELVEPDGERVELLLSNFADDTPIPEVRVTFTPLSGAGRPRLGYGPAGVFVHDQPQPGLR